MAKFGQHEVFDGFSWHSVDPALVMQARLCLNKQSNAALVVDKLAREGLGAPASERVRV